jgi:hypothetical protein
MTKSLKKVFLIILIPFCSFIFIQSCAEDPEPSLYPENPVNGLKPIINAINPAEALGGVTVLTIDGLNFSPKPEENLVSFSGAIASVLSASTTQLVVKTPFVVGDSIYIKIAVNGAVDFSDTLIYPVKAAAEELYGFQNFEKPYGMTVDKNSNVYLSLVNTGVGAGIKKITPTDSLFDFAPKGAETQWTSLKIGSGGILYAAKDVRGIWKIEEGVTPPNQPYILPPAASKIYDFDYDANGNIWAVGNNNTIFRVTPDLTVTQIPFKANLKSVRVFESALYVAGLKDSVEGVWRFPIIGNELDTANTILYFNLSEAYAGKAFAVTFDLDGDMYIGTDAAESIIVVHPDGSHEPLYPGIFLPITQNFCWGTGTKLYATRYEGKGATQTVLVIEMQKPGAPYYGRDL